MSNVRSLPGAHRPHGALNWLGEELAADEEPAGVVVAVVRANGDIAERYFGRIQMQHLTWIGARLIDEGLHGDSVEGDDED